MRSKNIFFYYFFSRVSMVFDKFVVIFYLLTINVLSKFSDIYQNEHHDYRLNNHT